MSGCPFTGAGAGQPLRPELPPLPRQLRKLPLYRGYPVPWFVVVQDGMPDFRVADGERFAQAMRRNLCPICGQPLRAGQPLAFNIGPMCAVNLRSAEPPGHAECAHWSAQACPFLSRPNMTRREGGHPTGTQHPAGHMLMHNPGVALVWETRTYALDSDGMGGALLALGAPVKVTAYTAGRPATPAELLAAVARGSVALWQLCQGDADVRDLERLLGNAAVRLRLDSRELLAAARVAVKQAHPRRDWTPAAFPGRPL